MPERSLDAASVDSPTAARRVLSAHAPSLVTLFDADPELGPSLLSRPIRKGASLTSMRRALEQQSAGMTGPELDRALRRYRHRALVRIALREILRVADIDDTSAELSSLAEALIDRAVEGAEAAVAQRFGRPARPDGVPVPFVVLGMGKLGGGELNFGSDIDLCFFYETDDAEVPGDAITTHDFFTRVAQRVTQSLSEVTEDGFCFRVDLRLRPEGTRGPLVNSLASAERYYETWGRTWERAALLRARPVGGDRTLGAELLSALAPFVYRREVNPALAAEMGEMLRRTRRELAVDDGRDIKLGTGGIREIEFFVQTLQLIWGGRDRSLRRPRTIDALRRLATLGHVRDRQAHDLERAWSLLRRVEHRIHMTLGYQTHAIPPEGEARDAMARSLGVADGDALAKLLGRTRARVAAIARTLIGDDQDAVTPFAALADRIASGDPPAAWPASFREDLGLDDPEEAAAHLTRLAKRAESPLGPVMRDRFPSFGPQLLREIGDAANPDAALRLLADFFARVGAPAVYARLFSDEPRLLRRLVSLFGASETLSALLVSHPEDVDRLLAAEGVPDGDEIRSAHVPLAAQSEDAEQFVTALRRLKRTSTIQLGLGFVSREIDLVETTARLTALAEAQIEAALSFASAEIVRKTGGDPDRARALVVIGLGKLGGFDLGFGSDLDVVFVYDEADRDDGEGLSGTEFFSKIAQRAMRLLSQPDAEGPGYETDARLRPSGSRGLLCTSVAAFDRYHAESAQGWERLALARARPVAGSPAAALRVAEIVARTVYGSPAPDPSEIAAMRGRIERELADEAPDALHPKLGYGALVDIEFIAQWMSMRHGADRTVRTLDALAALASVDALSTAELDGLSEAWSFFRALEQAIRLLGSPRDHLPRVGTHAEHIARRLGLRDRDGHLAAEVLWNTYLSHARFVRGTFETRIETIGTTPPWERR